MAGKVTATVGKLVQKRIDSKMNFQAKLLVAFTVAVTMTVMSAVVYLVQLEKRTIAQNMLDKAFWIVTGKRY